MSCLIMLSEASDGSEAFATPTGVTLPEIHQRCFGMIGACTTLYVVLNSVELLCFLDRQWKRFRSRFQDEAWGADLSGIS
jgi:hypothetical protein